MLLVYSKIYLDKVLQKDIENKHAWNKGIAKIFNDIDDLIADVDLF